ncbi:hypothetical protein GGI12_001628 [Dipsacomyces acuminosporus]|nr:hypothetical protein GGI12_001628 [Dipsacomyces acuminosporus]
MSHCEPHFRKACLAWLSQLSNEDILDIDGLVDARIFIDVVTKADPEYFSSASIVLPGRPGEPNLDALAQLARLLLRYFEQGFGKQLMRDYIPGVATLASRPFDDLWKLLVLTVAVTLLSERNSASNVYEKLDDGAKAELQKGIERMWEGAANVGSGMLDLEKQGIGIGGSSASSAILSHGSVSSSVPKPGDEPSGKSRSANTTGNLAAHASSSNTSLHGSKERRPGSRFYGVSNDSVSSVQTSFQQFKSAYSSFPDQQALLDGFQQPGSEHSNRLLGVSVMSSSSHSPAVLQTDDRDDGSINTIESTDTSSNGTRALAGFEQSDSEEDEDDRFDTDSYVSEFSQDLAEYGQDVVSVGYTGPHSIASYLFVANMAAYVLVGCYLLLWTKTPSKRSPYFKDFYDMVDAIAQVSLASLVSVVLSVIWIQILRYQTRKVVWLTTLGVPVVSVFIAVWASTQIFRIPGAENLVSYRVRSAIVIGVSLILAVRFIWSISQRRQDIERSVDIIRLACDVLVDNKEVYAFSVLLLAFYGSFAVVSGIFASRLPLVQSLTGGFQGSAAVWLVTAHHWALPSYLVATFAWTSAVFVQILRMVISSVVCQWYFHRHDPQEPPALQTLQASVVSALTKQFGTVVVSATILLIAKTIHLFELLLRWVVRLLRVIPVSIISLVVGRPVYFAEGLSSYSSVYAAFTGKGLFESSRAVTRLLRKHHLLHSPVVSLIKSSMTSYSLLISMVFGYMLGTKAVEMLSVHSVAVAVAGSALPFALLQLVTHVLSCTVEALVVCYAIDLEVDSCHSIKVAEAMAFA